MLIGIVKKNAIMQIDFALEAERRRDMSPADAIREGCLIRLPITDDDYGGAVRGRCRSRWGSAPAGKRGGRWASRWSAVWWCRRH